MSKLPKEARSIAPHNDEWKNKYGNLDPSATWTWDRDSPVRDNPENKATADNKTQTTEAKMKSAKNGKPQMGPPRA